MIETYSIEMIYVSVLVQGYTISRVSKVNKNEYLVSMRKGPNVINVILKPREQDGLQNQLEEV